MEDAFYSPYPLGRRFPVAILAVWALIDLVVVASGGSYFYFNLVFTVGLLYASYVFLWILAGELSLSGGWIFWRTPIRSGRVRTADVRRIRPANGFSHGLLTIEMDDGESIKVMCGSHFRAFYGALQMSRPDLSVN